MHFCKILLQQCIKYCIQAEDNCPERDGFLNIIKKKKGYHHNIFYHDIIIIRVFFCYIYLIVE